MKDKIKKIVCGSLVALSLPVLVACGDKPTLAKPKGLSIDQTTNLITWQAVENAEYYLVEINGQTYQSTTTSFPANDIFSQGGKFYVRVVAIDRDDEFLQSAFSDFVSVDKLLAFNTPVLSIDNIVLNWTDVGAEYYVISINNVKFEVSGTNLNLAELDNEMLSAINFGKSNSFKVYAKATSNNLKSEVSNIVDVYVAASQSAPTNLNVQKQGENVVLTFDSVSTASSYTVKVNQTEFTTDQTTVDIGSYLTNGFGDYSVSVKANKVEEIINEETTLTYMDSAYSNVFVYEHKPKFVNEQVGGLTINNGVLTFDEVQDATSYIVFVNNNQYQTNTNSYNLASLNLSAGKYGVSVMAKNGNYASLISNETEYKVTAVLNAPSIYCMEQDSNIKLVISAVANATMYQLQINQIVFNTSSLQVDITSYLVQGTNSISVIAVGDNDIYFNSVESKTSYILLGVPQNLSLKNGVLSFDAVVDSSGYEIYINDKLCLTTENTSVDISTYIEQVGIYQIKVRAVANDQKGVYASISHITTEKLNAPQNLVISNNNNAFTLTFTHDGKNVVCYDVYINGSLACQPTTTSVDITNYLQLGENIVYVVAIGDGTIYLNSVESQSQSVTITKTLEKVQNLSVYAESGNYYVSFEGVEDADSYVVQIANHNFNFVLNQTILASELNDNVAKINISSAITQTDDYSIFVTANSYVQGVSQSTVTITQKLYSYNLAEYQSKKYFYNGKDYTYSINSAEELKKFVYYAVLYRLDSAEVYINFDYTGKSSAFESTDSLIQDYLPSISKYGVKIEQGDVLGQLFNQDNLANLPEILAFIEEAHDQIYLYFDVTSSLTSQKSNCVYTLNFEYVGDYEATVTNSSVQKTLSGVQTRTFAIDSLQSAPVETVAQLLMVVQNGRKPEFVVTDKIKNTLVDGKSIAERTYLMAREVLNEICNDTMTDFEKALAIHDWIVKTNEYDDDTCSSAEGAPFSSDNLTKMSFYASGMLLKDLSVCKGYAQAFSLMCNIEGIKTVETFGITGSGIDWKNVDFTTPAEEIAIAAIMPAYATQRAVATYNLLNKINTIGAHSWNRIYLDIGQGEQWYIVDATWESQYGNTDFVTHDYFLVNDDTIAINRKEFYPNGQFYQETDVNNQPIDFSANGSYNYYTDTNISTYITTQAQLNAVVENMISNNHLGFEVIFDSSIVDDYNTMISQAFTANSLNVSDYNKHKTDNYVVVYKKS